MAGHRQLFGGREDPHPDVAATLGRQNERRLGEVHLFGDELHLLRRQFAGLGEDGQLIAFEAAIGEDVEVEVAVHGVAVEDDRVPRPLRRANQGVVWMSAVTAAASVRLYAVASRIGVATTRHAPPPRSNALLRTHASPGFPLAVRYPVDTRRTLVGETEERWRVAVR